MIRVALFLLALAAPAQALTIYHDDGGYVADYMARFANVLRSGERVEIRGDCRSACTLVLGIVPRERMCVTAQARFGFHRAYIFDGRGRPQDSAAGTEILMAIYPPSVRAWLAAHGGLTRTMKFMSAAASGLRPCQ